jgi:Ni,Fe-hydrogenase I cytochrome b subunit
MNSGYYDLDKPIAKVVKSEMVKFSINNIVVNPFKLATMSVMLVDELDTVIDGMFLILEGEEYELWNSDEYLVNWVRLQIDKKYNTNI